MSEPSGSRENPNRKKHGLEVFVAFRLASHGAVSQRAVQTRPVPRTLAKLASMGVALRPFGFASGSRPGDSSPGAAMPFYLHADLAACLRAPTAITTAHRSHT